jgi:hypothetical protein
MNGVNERFENVQSLAAAHHEKLKETYALFQFFQDLDDEEAWIEYVSPAHWVMHQTDSVHAEVNL